MNKYKNHLRNFDLLGVYEQAEKVGYQVSINQAWGEFTIKRPHSKPWLVLSKRLDLVRPYGKTDALELLTSPDREWDRKRVELLDKCLAKCSEGLHKSDAGEVWTYQMLADMLLDIRKTEEYIKEVVSAFHKTEETKKRRDIYGWLLSEMEK